MNKKSLRRVVIGIVLAIGLGLMVMGVRAMPSNDASVAASAPSIARLATVPLTGTNGVIKLVTPAPPNTVAPSTNAPSAKTNSVEPHYPTNADPRFNTNGFYRGVGTNRVPSN